MPRLAPLAILILPSFSLARAQSADTSAAEDDMFGDGPKAAPTPPPSQAWETLAWGGKVETGADLRIPDRTALSRAPLAAPTEVMLYADGRPSPNLRAFARLRLSTDIAARKPESAQDFRATLSEAWLKTDWRQRVFFTLGRQPVKWGSSRFWNPTDFLYDVARDPFAAEDTRQGLTLLKIHVPHEKSGANLYAIGQFDKAHTLGDMRGALRAEVPLSQAELAFTGATARKGLQQGGGDVSLGLRDFDFRSEVAWSRNLSSPDRHWKSRSTLGVEYTLPYGDKDSAVLGSEWHFNEAGTSDKNEYLPRLARGTAAPLSLGRRYMAAWAFLNNPFAIKDQSLTFSYIENLDDKTWLVRVDSHFKAGEGGTLSLYGSWHDGPKGGELLFENTTPPLNIVATRAEAGARLSVSF